MHNEVTNYIKNAPQEQQEIMTVIRKLIHAKVPNVMEEFKWRRPVFKQKKDFAYLVANKKHVNFGFSQFEKIKNPTDRLEGTGKTMRHVKLRTISDVDEQLFGEWLEDMNVE